jgi:hypothetical protein
VQGEIGDADITVHKYERARPQTLGGVRKAFTVRDWIGYGDGQIGEGLYAGEMFPGAPEGAQEVV